MNTRIKDQMLRLIESDSRRKAAGLSIALARAKSEDKEKILAAFEFEHWLSSIANQAQRA